MPHIINGFLRNLCGDYLNVLDFFRLKRKLLKPTHPHQILNQKRVGFMELEEYNSTTFTILITVLLEGGLKVDLSSQYFHIKYDKD